MSSHPPTALPTLAEFVREQERVLAERPLLRAIYRGWHELVAARLAPLEPTVELGAGLGRLRDVVPGTVVTDVEATDFTDEVVDAVRMPYGESTVGNLVLIDVFHHLTEPAGFLDEAVRTLQPGGRVVLLEPYCSPLSTWAYDRFHDEPVDLAADPFAAGSQVGGHPLEANTALPTLAFFRCSDALARRWPQLELRERRRLSFLLYPLSGGFSRRPLVPPAAAAPLRLVERALRPIAPLIAFRCLVVLERRA